MKSTALTPQQHMGIRNTILLTLLGSVALVLFVLVNNDFDPVVFANVGTQFSEGDPEGSKGYDGQFVYFIARDGGRFHSLPGRANIAAATGVVSCGSAGGGAGAT